MLKRFCAAFGVCVCLLCAAPVCAFADDAAAATAETADGISRDDVQDVQDNVSDAIDEYDGGFDSAFAEVKQAWDDTIFGPVRFAAFSADLIGDVYDAFPAYKFYIILLFIVIPVAALVRIFIKA